ncbi:MAG: DUF2188 domain-containing protein [Candidatus Binatia bacterium]
MQAKKRTLKAPTKTGKIQRSRIRTVIKALHVMPKSDGWMVTTSGPRRLTQQFPDKQEAVEFGESVAKRQKTSLIVHGRDGRIEQVDSYGADPFPPRDRNR